MRFWDSSAIIPLLVTEAHSTAARVHYELDPDMAVWWATETECVSALTRLERDGRLGAAEITVAIARLDLLGAAWQEIQPIARIRQIAIRLLRTHPLWAADALQIAAAIIAAEDQPASLGLVTFDQRLAEVSAREGFTVSGPG
jgi:predicted nucleic acid-binding protein